jgi:hypothetical protein
MPIGQNDRSNCSKASGRLVALKFPVISNKFPDRLNVFPVSLIGELSEK